MINLCFGMRHINISQLPYSDFSHPNGALDLCGEDTGISLWFAQGSWKCIAGPWGNGTFFFTHVDSNGNPARLMCADGQQRIVTIALTHSEQVYVHNKVGEVYRNMDKMYEEGRKGQATGNHIHVEVAAGIQKSKYYDPDFGCYRMSMELNPLETFFVNDGFSTVINEHGAKLKHCKHLDTEGADMVIGVGYQEKTVGDITAIIYRGNKAKGYTLHLIPAGENYNSVADIGQIDSDRLSVLAKMNCSYFQMNNSDYGCHYGVEQDSTVRGYHQEPKAPGIKVMWLDHDGNVGCCDQSDYWLSVDDVQMACAPYAMRKHLGDDTVLWSSSLGDKDDVKNTQSCAVKFANGDWALAAFTTPIYPRDVLTYFNAFDELILEIALFDSGGSTQLCYWNGEEMKKAVYTGRKIPNVLAIARPRGMKDEATAEENPKDPEHAETDQSSEIISEYVKSLQESLRNEEERHDQLIQALRKLVEQYE